MASTQDISMAVNIPPNAPPHVYAAAAEQCLEWGRPDGALQVSELGLQRHPSYAGLRLFRAEALLLHKRMEQGEEDLRAVLAAEPQHPRALKLLTQLLVSQRRYREALPILERAEFILIGDSEVSQWLAAAEKGVQEEALAPPKSAAGNPLFSPEVSERFGELADTPGVRAVLLTEGEHERHGGPEWPNHAALLGHMRTLEEHMGGVLAEAGFGELLDAYLHGGDATLMSHRAAKMTVRVAADSRTREGLIAWQCRKALGETAE